MVQRTLNKKTNSMSGIYTEKVSGFTLQEVLIAAVILLLFLGMSFFVLNYFFKKSMVFNELSSEKYKSISAFSVIQSDMNKSHRLLLIDANSFKVYTFNEMVLYNVQDGFLYRNSVKLIGNVTNVTFLLQAKKVTNGLFDALHIRFSNELNKSHSYFFEIIESSSHYILPL